MREITREEAIELFRKQWVSMQKVLGNNPKGRERALFKKEWCKSHGCKNVAFNCFLCEYVIKHGLSCSGCPIEWREDCTGNVDYRHSPISEILALPEREVRKSES